MSRRSIAARRVTSAVGTSLMVLAAALAVFPLLDIIFVVAKRGIPALSPALFTTVTSGVAGGLANAITGTLLLVAAALVLAAPIGILSALFVSEFASPRVALFVRSAADTLAGVPSIVLGYFGYVTMVVWLGWGFSLLAAAITLMIMMLPYTMRASEIAMRKVPDELREASLALGATRTATAFRIVLRGAVPGILTGVLLSAGIAMGETAPLIYTAGWSSYLPTGRLLHAPVGYLTYVVWTYINEPFASAHALAYAAALVLILLVLLFNVAGRLILRRRAGSAR